MQIGPLGDSIFYILASFWSRDSQVRKSPPCRKSLKYSHTHTHTLTRKHTDGPQKSSHNTALVMCLVCLGVSAVCVLCICVRTQSHISSGISWGLRMPGTDICSLCFSSWAWRSDASLSSRNRSEVSSPANSYRYRETGKHSCVLLALTALPERCHLCYNRSLSISHTPSVLVHSRWPIQLNHASRSLKGQRDSTLSLSISISATTHSQLHKHYYYWFQNICIWQR